MVSAQQAFAEGLDAAGLWASACMGLFIGIGFYEGAVVMCAFLFAVIVVLNQIDARYLKSSASLRLYLGNL